MSLTHLLQYYLIPFFLFCIVIKVLAIIFIDKKWLEKIVKAIVSIAICISIVCIVFTGINIYEWNKLGKHLDPDKNNIVYARGEFRKVEKVVTKGRTKRTDFYGYLTYEVDSIPYGNWYRVPDKYADYIYFVKVNRDKPEYSDNINIRIKALPKNSGFVVREDENSQRVTIYPINDMNIPGYSDKIMLQDINQLKFLNSRFSSPVENLIYIPKDGWNTDPRVELIKGYTPHNTTTRDILIYAILFLQILILFILEFYHDRKINKKVDESMSKYLTQEEVYSLLGYLEIKIAENMWEDTKTNENAIEWIRKNKGEEYIGLLLEEFESMGGYTDGEIFLNCYNITNK